MFTFSYRNSSLFFFAAFFLSCGSASRSSSDRSHPVIFPISPADSDRCSDDLGEHSVFSILIDGHDVGREVRTDFLEQGEFGPERVLSSHSVKRIKINDIQVDTHSVRLERTGAITGILLSGSHVRKDHVSVETFEITRNEKHWNRSIHHRSLVEDSGTSYAPTRFFFKGNEVIGLRLNDLLRKTATTRCVSPLKVTYYELMLDEPVELTVSCPEAGTIVLHNQSIKGKWVQASRSDTDRVIVRSFYDETGTLWEEQYPYLHQVQRRMLGPLSLADETTELILGLQSEAYLPIPNSATRALFRLSSTEERLDSLDLISQPLNQTVLRREPKELLLEVRAGAPDGDEPPTEADLGSFRYVQPDHPDIVAAYTYLRTASKRGHLSELRRENATPVIARASLIQNPKRFWSDPDQVAGLLMHYVSALLPDKRRTLSMADAVTTLERGAGDCTEHAVLFASLMRAHGIPTRLVTGMYLVRGGMWGYHMWNSYWNGSSWQSIDPSTMSYRPGALYVALGRGVARFQDVRDHLADFMWRAFAGVSFDLIEADDNGEKLYLARPRGLSGDPREIASFKAMVLYERGDYEGAIAVLDEGIPDERRPLALKLMYVELLFHAGRFDKAVDRIASLRQETSQESKIALLDELELRCLLATGRFDAVEPVYDRIRKRLAPDDHSARMILKARYLFGLGRQQEALDFLHRAVEKYPQDAPLLTAFARHVALSSAAPSPQMIDSASKAAARAVFITKAADHETLFALASILFKAGRPVEAGWFLDQALILSPLDRGLHDLREQIWSHGCGSNE